MEAKIEVPSQVRELVVVGIANAETALSFFFDAVAKSNVPATADSLALLRRVITVKFDYARKVALAKDVLEATALQFAYCRAQIEITTDLIRTISDLRTESSGADN